MKKHNLTEKEIEVVNLGASIAAGCQPCTRYHVKKCKDTGISESEIDIVIKKTEQICNIAIEIMILKALKSVNLNNEKELEFHIANDNRKDILIGLAVSYTLNSTTLFENFSKLAGAMELGKEEISDIIEISKFIFSKAKAHVDMISEEVGVEKQNNEQADCSPGCNC